MNLIPSAIELFLSKPIIPYEKNRIKAFSALTPFAGLQSQSSKKFIREVLGWYFDMKTIYQKSVNNMVNDSFPPKRFCSRYKFGHCSLNISLLPLLLLVTGVVDEADNAYSIQSTCLCCQPVQFFTTELL